MSSRPIFWGLLVLLVLLSAFWHYQTQQHFEQFVEVNRGFAVEVKNETLSESPNEIKVQFTVVLKNSSHQEIPLDGISCQIYVEKEFLSVCAIVGEIAPYVPVGGEWRLSIETPVKDHYYQTYQKAKEAGSATIEVRGTVEIRLPTGRGSMKTTRRFNKLVPGSSP